MAISSIEPGCEFCDKRGLPALLLRYASAPKTAGAPQTSALDADGKTAMPSLGEDLHYTRRLLRPGYLYSFDEARDRWEGYYVTNDSYLMRFQVGKPVPPSYTPDLQPCSRHGHPAIAGMVTISDPKNASNIWFGFSDVEWTAAVLQKHQDAGYRKKHMQVLNVPAALAGAKQVNVHGLKASLSNKVAEYACDPLKATAVNGFFGAPFKFSPRHNQREETLEAVQFLNPHGGVLVTLHDPVGVAIEVAAAMSARLEAQLQLTKNDRVYCRKIAVANTIDQLRNAVRSNAESDRLDQAVTDPAYAYAAAGPGIIFDRKLQQSIEKTAHVSAQELDAAQANAWSKYTTQENGKARFDESAANAFYKSHDQQLKEFTKTKITPLGQAHIGWVKSQHMQNYLTCNFDHSNLQSGLAYLEVLIKITQGTEGVEPCFAQYQKWLDAGQFEPDNLLLRALVLNQDNLASKVKQASAFDPKTIAWDGLLGSYKEALAGLSKGHTDRLTVLLSGMAGPLAKAVGSVLDGAARPAISALGFIHGGGWKLDTYQGTRKEFRVHLTRLVLEAAQPKLNESQLKLAVDRQIKLAKIRGEKLEGQAGMRWLTWLEPKAVGQGQPVLRSPATHQKTLAEVRYQSFKKISSIDVRAGVCIGIVQAWCLTKNISDYDRSLAGDKAEAGWRLFAGSLAVTGTLIEGLGIVIKNAHDANLPLARHLPKMKWAERTILGGKALGLVGGVIMGVWDLAKGKDAFEKGEKIAGWLYVSSAGLGISVALMFAFGVFNVFTVLAVAAFLTVAYFLEQSKTTAIQTWLENCIFGSVNKYQSAEVEMKEYALAIG